MFCLEHNIQIPEPKILKKNLTATAAREFESKFWHLYKDDGWNMINSESSLGYLGGNYNKIWTEENIRKFIKEHPDIRRGSLVKTNSAIYKEASKLGILDDLFGENERKPYTKEDIFNFVKNHPEIKTREQLRNAGAGVYKAAWKFKMLDELFGDSLVKERTKEELMSYLKEHPEIKRRIDLFNASRRMHHIAEKFGILEELFGERQRTIKWTKETIKEYIINNPDIKTKADLYRKAKRAYDRAKILNIFDELFPEK